MRAMLLCAGLSTRLGPLGDQLPKPLLPVCDIPIVRYGISLLAKHGIQDIVINLHHHGDQFRRELGDGESLGVRIQYSQEDEILDTGGGLKKALPLLDPHGHDEPFISMNGKLIFDVDLGALVSAFAPNRDALGMMVVRRVPRATEWGAVDVDESTTPPRVRNILGEGQFMFGGIHVTRPSVIRRLPDGKACMVRQGYLPWIHAGEPVLAFDAGQGYFAEHSLPSRYLESNIALLDRKSLPFVSSPLAQVSPRARIASTARIQHPVHIGDNATIGEHAVVGPHAVIGHHAIVEANSNITRCVVWPRARAHGEIRDAVVTWKAVVAAGAA